MRSYTCDVFYESHHTSICPEIQFAKKFYPQSQVRDTKVCDHCNKEGHVSETYFARLKEEIDKIICLWCNRPGHSANFCYQLVSPDWLLEMLQARTQNLK